MAQCLPTTFTLQTEQNKEPKWGSYIYLFENWYMYLQCTCIYMYMYMHMYIDLLT